MRESKGKGVGDDTTIWLSSFLPDTFRKKNYVGTSADPISRILAGVSGDSIDTFEKDSRFYFPGGQDEFAGKYVNELFKELCEDRRFREAFGIEKRKNSEYTLVDEDVLVDYTIAGANTKRGSVHSSQRWFYKDISEAKIAPKATFNERRTCAIKEEIKHMYNCASAMYDLDPKILRNLNLNDKYGFKKKKMTFDQIPVGRALKTFDKRLALVQDPNMREEKLLEFYSNS